MTDGPVSRASGSADDSGTTGDVSGSSGASGDDWRDAVDHVAIDRVVRAYADAVNRRAWPELDGLFTPDAHIHLDLGTRGTRQFSGPGEIGAHN